MAISKKAINTTAKFIKDSIDTLLNSGATCCRLNIKGDSELAIFVGWLNGYDENDDTIYHDGSYGIVAGVMKRNDDDWADFEYLNMPIANDDSGDVFNTQITLDKKDADDGFKKVAEDLINYYNEAREGVDNGTLRLI